MKRRAVKSKNRKKRIRAAKLMQILRKHGIIEEKGAVNEKPRAANHYHKEHDDLRNE